MLYQDFLLKNNFGVRPITLQHTWCWKNIAKMQTFQLFHLKDKVNRKSHFKTPDKFNGRISSTAVGDLDDDEGDVEGDEEEGEQPEVDVLYRPPQLPVQVFLVETPGNNFLTWSAETIRRSWLKSST